MKEPLIQRPIYLDHNPDYAPDFDGMGSWLSKAINKTVGWVAGKGNTPGTPETRKYGYDPNEVSKAVVAQIQNPANASNTAASGKLILGGAAGLALLLILSKKRR